LAASWTSTIRWWSLRSQPRRPSRDGVLLLLFEIMSSVG
jgi:hypothetical protein